MGKSAQSEYVPKHVVVTGGVGFIGSHLVDCILARFPEATVTVYDSFTYAADIRNLALATATGRLKIVRACVTDRETLGQSLQGADAVFHLAAESHVPRSFDDPELFDRINHLGSLITAQTAADLGVERFVHMSTDEVYGPSAVRLRESAELKPTTPYARSKAQAEDAVRAFTGMMDLRIVRPVNTIGPRQHLEKLLPRFASQALQGEPFTIEGSGEQTRNFVSVDDVCDALLLVLTTRRAKGGTFNIFGSDILSVRQVASEMARLAGVEESLETATDREINDVSYAVDGTALSLLGHRNRNNFEYEGRRVLEDVRKRLGSTANQVKPPRRFIQAPPIAPTAADLTLVPKKKIAFHVPWRSPTTQKTLEDVVSAGRLAGGGKFTRSAEEKIKAETGAHAVWLTHSCTAAMEVSALALGLGPDDEVIVPTYTFCATATAFERSGAKVVFADIDPDTLMLSTESVLSRVTERTKAVVAVHYGGAVLDLDPLKAALSGTNIQIVEDAAQAVGSSLHGKAGGTRGIMGCYSFHDTKVLSSGQGGALLLNAENASMAQRINTIMNRGTNFEAFRAGAVSHYEWVDHGGSYLPSELQSGLIDGQWPHLRDIVARRRQIAEAYAGMLSSDETIYQRLRLPLGTTSNHHIEALILPTAEEAESLIGWLAQNGIEAQSHYKPLHLSARGRQVDPAARCPVADDLWNRIVRLPIHTAMSVDDAKYVAAKIEDWSESNRTRHFRKTATF